MLPDLTFTVFDFSVTIASYSFFSALGAVCGVVTALAFLKNAGLSRPCSFSLLLMMAVFFLMGARLLNFVINGNIYENAMRLTSFRFAGFSLYGGILGALGALIFWSRLAHRSPWPLLDALILPTATAFVLARIGCYLNGCCAGKATDSCLGVVFPASAESEKIIDAIMHVLPVNEIAVYPTQLFEAGLAVLGLVPALWLYFGKKYSHGTAFLVYGIWFCAMRLAVLQLRNLPYPEFVTKAVYPLLYGLLIFVGIILIRHLNTKRR